MKYKIITVLLFFSFLVCSCQKQLNVTVEYNSKNPYAAPTLYWVNNNTGADIIQASYILNDEYFYTGKLPSGGVSIDFEEFAKKNGERFNIAAIKPKTLKVKANGAVYAVNVDDIPLYTGVVPGSEYEKKTNTLLWSDKYSSSANTADGTAVLLTVVFGHYQPKTELIKYETEISDFLTNFISAKNIEDFIPTNEKNLQTEIKELLNNQVLKNDLVEIVRIYDILY